MTSGLFAFRTISTALALAGWALAAHAADVHKLTPANPQPDPSMLKPGSHVEYIYREAKTLHEAKSWLGYGDLKKPGKPLQGFTYEDTKLGEDILTAEADELVIASIDGYLNFPEPGTYKLTFWANDGLRVSIGGVEVYEHDGRHPCETLGPETVQVPEAGWYAVEALFFQRLSTACLVLEWQKPGESGDTWSVVPVEAYAHTPK